MRQKTTLEIKAVILRDKEQLSLFISEKKLAALNSCLVITTKMLAWLSQCRALKRQGIMTNLFWNERVHKLTCPAGKTEDSHSIFPGKMMLTPEKVATESLFGWCSGGELGNVPCLEKISLEISPSPQVMKSFCYSPLYLIWQLPSP